MNATELSVMRRLVAILRGCSDHPCQACDSQIHAAQDIIQEADTLINEAVLLQPAVTFTYNGLPVHEYDSKRGCCIYDAESPVHNTACLRRRK